MYKRVYYVVNLFLNSPQLGNESCKGFNICGNRVFRIPYNAASFTYRVEFSFVPPRFQLMLPLSFKKFFNNQR